LKIREGRYNEASSIKNHWIGTISGRLFFDIRAFYCSRDPGSKGGGQDPATGQSAEVPLYNKSYAVVIGIDQYQNPLIHPLMNAVKDARGVKQVLERHYRFQRIITLFNQEAF
jgi:hypothetical protein